MPKLQLPIVIQPLATAEYAFEAVIQGLHVDLRVKGLTDEDVYREAKALALEFLASRVRSEPVASDYADTVEFEKKLEIPLEDFPCESEEGAYAR